jgi:hypothetical protein
MRRLTLALVLAVTAFGAAAHENFSINGEDCTASNFRWNDRPTFVSKETIDGRGLRAIKARVSHAPVTVSGNDGGGYSIEVCKAASRQEDLADIHVSLDGDELRATGPDNTHWTVLYHIFVPRNGSVDVETKNGPLSLRDVDGTIVAHSSNGPLSLRNVSGRVDATTTNGPISLQGGSGTMKMTASNGPISIHLDGASWQGGTLDASTKNGPLSVKIPRGYGSGVVVETNGRGPLSCRAEGCDQWRAQRRLANDDDDDDFRIDDDQPRRIELGSGRADVHLSTVNGPVTIKDE